MISLFRRHQKVLMIVVTVLVIVAFVWLYNYTSLDKVHRQVAGRIYGREVPQIEVDRRGRLFQLAYQLGLEDLLAGLDALSQDPRRAVQNFIVNSYVLEHASRHYQIEPSAGQIASALSALLVFQTHGQFDPAKYAQLVDRALGSRGFTEAELEGLVRDQLRVRRLREILTAGVAVSPAEIRETYERLHRKRNLSLIRFPLESFRAQVRIDDAEIRARFEAEPGSFQTPERRSIRYVQFRLPEEAAALEGRARVEALQKLADQAGAFTQAMLTPGADFAAEAAKAGLTVGSTGEFARGEQAPGLEKFPATAEAAFRLTPTDPNSDALQGPDGFVVLHLDQVVPARPMTLEEATPRLRELMTDERAREAMARRAEEVRATVSAALAAGTPLAEAARQVGVEVETLKPFALSEPPRDLADARQLIRPALELQPGSLSSFLPSSDGGLLVHVGQPEPVDEADLAARTPEVARSLLERKQDLLFQEWLLAAQREAAPPRRS